MTHETINGTDQNIPKRERKPRLKKSEKDRLNAPYRDVLNNLNNLPQIEPVSIEEAAESYDIIFNNNRKRYLKDLPHHH